MPSLTAPDWVQNLYSLAAPSVDILRKVPWKHIPSASNRWTLRSRNHHIVAPEQLRVYKTDDSPHIDQVKQYPNSFILFGCIYLPFQRGSAHFASITHLPFSVHIERFIKQIFLRCHDVNQITKRSRHVTGSINVYMNSTGIDCLCASFAKQPNDLLYRFDIRILKYRRDQFHFIELCGITAQYVIFSLSGAWRCTAPSKSAMRYCLN